MQSPRSPLDWEHESQASDHDRDELDDLEERITVIETKLKSVERVISRNIKRGLIGTLFHVLDILLLDFSKALAQSLSNWH